MKLFFVQDDFLSPGWGQVILKLFKSKVIIQTLVPCHSLGKGRRMRYTPYLDRTTIPIAQEGK